MPKLKKSSHLSKKKRHILVLIIGFVCMSSLTVFLLSSAADINPEWIQPTVKKSVNGTLDVTLHAKEQTVSLAGTETKLPTYNDKYIGDTWDIKGGDTVKVHLKNDLEKPTNLHFHGSHVSPKGNSDNVLLSIKPGETFEYEYKLPVNHPPGLYWYHPHFHPDVENQVLGGMVGSIKVRGDVDELPGIKGLPEKLWVLTTQDGKNPNTPTRLVNGLQNPTMYLRPGQTTRLEIVNASADDFFNLAIPGYMLHVYSRDGNTLDEIQSVQNEHLAPGQRVEILFTPKNYETIPVKSLYFDQGFAKYVETTFMNIKVQGLPTIATPLPKKLLPYTELRNTKVDKVRTLTFSEAGTATNPTFLLDEKEVDMDRIDQVMTLGTTEEWRLVNKSSEMHPFHIHINPFQVISVNGRQANLHGYRDTVGVPGHGEVVIRTQYKDFDGKFVLHCHILFHEDHGMMQVVEIVKSGADQAEDNGFSEREISQEEMMEHMNHTTVDEGHRRH